VIILSEILLKTQLQKTRCYDQNEGGNHSKHDFDEAVICFLLVQKKELIKDISRINIKVKTDHITAISKPDDKNSKNPEPILTESGY
jgi:hypothetical protein